MSASARRLTGTVATDRFSWQRDLTPAAPAAPLFSGHTGQTTVTPALRDLPSPAAERLLAAEREAFAKGYAEGERAGERAAVARTDAVMKRLTATIDEIASLRQGLMHRAERDLVRLAVAMAERIVRREIDLDRELLVVMARVAIDRLGETAVASVHLHPADYQAATNGQPLPAGSVQVVADPAVPRGGCVVRSSFGTIDAGIDSQVRELSRALLGDDGQEEDPAHGVSSDL
jgi:flagellar assembly protein FliH